MGKFKVRDYKTAKYNALENQSNGPYMEEEAPTPKSAFEGEPHKNAANAFMKMKANPEESANILKGLSKDEKEILNDLMMEEGSQKDTTPKIMNKPYMAPEKTNQTTTVESKPVQNRSVSSEGNEKMNFLKALIRKRMQ